MPCLNPLGVALIPGGECATVMAVRAVHAQRIGVVHHQAVNVLRTLDRRLVTGGQRGITSDPGCVVLEQITCEGIKGERRISIGLLMRDVLHLVNHA